ncbi:Uncharacterised protein [Mycobacteroides abscessus subsp. abscessus]|nr:Uncharacterised protein [Mycobacteroides abscessus subsp. abscessus]SHW47375.1 Uncharacterised protein [Mycobacteroides abscessus subsp. abscessus]SII07432.1 Uncharacterised protein [Mycobacteroides abscessus subsp. abscessus]
MSIRVVASVLVRSLVLTTGLSVLLSADEIHARAASLSSRPRSRSRAYSLRDWAGVISSTAGASGVGSLGEGASASTVSVLIPSAAATP